MASAAKLNKTGVDEAEDTNGAKQRTKIEIMAPIGFWISILIIGLVIELLLIPLLAILKVQGMAGMLHAIVFGIIYLPGSAVLPLITALWIGLRIGTENRSVERSAVSGITNAVFTALVYAIAITVIYLLLFYSTPSFLSGITLIDFLYYSVALPVLILVLLVPLAASLSSARHY